MHRESEDEYAAAEPIRDLADPALAEAVEASHAEETACFSRHLPSGELHENECFTWVLTSGRAGVLRTRIADDDPAAVEHAVDTMLEVFQSRNACMRWVVGPATRPANLGTYLESRGLTVWGDLTVMALEIDRVAEYRRFPTEPIITRIVRREHVEALRTVYRECGYPPEAGSALCETYSDDGLRENAHWRIYLGWLDDMPVAACSLLLYAGVADIAGLDTVPERRRRGIGTALVRHALDEARAHGYRVAVLVPSAMARGIYQRLGFRDQFTVRHYQWSPR